MLYRWLFTSSFFFVFVFAPKQKSQKLFSSAFFGRSPRWNGKSFLLSPLRSPPDPPYTYVCSLVWLVRLARSRSVTRLLWRRAARRRRRRFCGTHKKYIISVLISICLSLRAPNVISLAMEKFAEFFFAPLPSENCFLCLSIVKWFRMRLVCGRENQQPENGW